MPQRFERSSYSNARLWKFSFKTKIQLRTLICDIRLHQVIEKPDIVYVLSRATPPNICCEPTERGSNSLTTWREVPTGWISNGAFTGRPGRKCNGENVSFLFSSLPLLNIGVLMVWSVHNADISCATVLHLVICLNSNCLTVQTVNVSSAFWEIVTSSSGASQLAKVRGFAQPRGVGRSATAGYTKQ